jgi:hypothetical protein
MLSCKSSENAMSLPAAAVRESRAATRDLELLFARMPGPRPSLTPGELYRRMSTEFKARRAGNHAACMMPMVSCRPDGALSLNWGLELLTARCTQCEPIVLDIAWRFAERYDVRLPEAQPSLSPQ